MTLNNAPSTGSGHSVDIMMIGHFAKDKLVVDGKSETASGGAVYYGSVALRRIGVRVAVVTRLHSNDFALLDELEQEGVRVFATAASETSGIGWTCKASSASARTVTWSFASGPTWPRGWRT
jgi:sugar/nucleoside kinase (ribokinase family)